MRTPTVRPAVAAALALATVAGGAPRAARAEPPLEIGAMTGGHRFAGDLELGVADAPELGSPASSGLVGARVGWIFSPRLTAEAELGWMPTAERMSEVAATVVGYRVHALVHLTTGGRLRPFVVAGAGWLELLDGAALDADTDFTYHWGVGARYALDHRFDLRVDGRHILAPSIDHNGASSDLEVTAGVTYRFGVAAPPPAPAPAPAPEPAPVVAAEPPPPPVERDSDHDGLIDSADRCPDRPEVDNGYKDDDGCPDAVRARLRGIGFRLGSADLDPASIPVLEKAVALLTETPRLRVAIEGHTSSEGGREHNVALSTERAEAVAAYLVARGVAAGRIDTAGYGPDRPLADNRTAAGREENRRIEFRIVEP